MFHNITMIQNAQMKSGSLSGKLMLWRPLAMGLHPHKLHYHRTGSSMWKSQHWPASCWPISSIKRAGHIHTETHLWRSNVTPNMSSSLSNSFRRSRFNNNKYRGFPQQSGPVWSALMRFLVVGFNLWHQVVPTRQKICGVQTMSRWLKLYPGGGGSTYKSYFYICLCFAHFFTVCAHYSCFG